MSVSLPPLYVGCWLVGVLELYSLTRPPWSVIFYVSTLSMCIWHYVIVYYSGAQTHKRPLWYAKIFLDSMGPLMGSDISHLEQFLWERSLLCFFSHSISRSMAWLFLLSMRFVIWNKLQQTWWQKLKHDKFKAHCATCAMLMPILVLLVNSLPRECVFFILMLMSSDFRHDNFVAMLHLWTFLIDWAVSTPSPRHNMRYKVLALLYLYHGVGAWA